MIPHTISASIGFMVVRTVPNSRECGTKGTTEILIILMLIMMIILHPSRFWRKWFHAPLLFHMTNSQNWRRPKMTFVTFAIWKIFRRRYFWAIQLSIPGVPHYQMLTRRGYMATSGGQWFKTKGEASPVQYNPYLQLWIVCCYTSAIYTIFTICINFCQ